MDGYPDDGVGFDLEQGFTVIAGLDIAQRAAFVASLRAALTGEPTSLHGVVELYGVEVDLSDPEVAETVAASGLDAVMVADDLPPPTRGATGVNSHNGGVTLGPSWLAYQPLESDADPLAQDLVEVEPTDEQLLTDEDRIELASIGPPDPDPPPPPVIAPRPPLDVQPPRLPADLEMTDPVPPARPDPPADLDVPDPDIAQLPDYPARPALPSDIAGPEPTQDPAAIAALAVPVPPPPPAILSESPPPVTPRPDPPQRPRIVADYDDEPQLPPAPEPPPDIAAPDAPDFDAVAAEAEAGALAQALARIAPVAAVAFAVPADDVDGDPAPTPPAAPERPAVLDLRIPEVPPEPQAPVLAEKPDFPDLVVEDDPPLPEPLPDPPAPTSISDPRPPKAIPDPPAPKAIPDPAAPKPIPDPLAPPDIADPPAPSQVTDPSPPEPVADPPAPDAVPDPPAPQLPPIVEPGPEPALSDAADDEAELARLGGVVEVLDEEMEERRETLAALRVALAAAASTSTVRDPAPIAAARAHLEAALSADPQRAHDEAIEISEGIGRGLFDLDSLASESAPAWLIRSARQALRDARESLREAEAAVLGEGSLDLDIVARLETSHGELSSLESRPGRPTATTKRQIADLTAVVERSLVALDLPNYDALALRLATSQRAAGAAARRDKARSAVIDAEAVWAELKAGPDDPRLVDAQHRLDGLVSRGRAVLGASDLEPIHVALELRSYNPRPVDPVEAASGLSQVLVEVGVDPPRDLDKLIAAADQFISAAETERLGATARQAETARLSDEIAANDQQLGDTESRRVEAVAALAARNTKRASAHADHQRAIAAHVAAVADATVAAIERHRLIADYDAAVAAAGAERDARAQAHRLARGAADALRAERAAAYQAAVAAVAGARRDDGYQRAVAAVAVRREAAAVEHAVARERAAEARQAQRVEHEAAVAEVAARREAAGTGHAAAVVRVIAAREARRVGHEAAVAEVAARREALAAEHAAGVAAVEVGRAALQEAYDAELARVTTGRATTLATAVAHREALLAWREAADNAAAEHREVHTAWQRAAAAIEERRAAYDQGAREFATAMQAHQAALADHAKAEAAWTRRHSRLRKQLEAEQLQRVAAKAAENQRHAAEVEAAVATAAAAGIHARVAAEAAHRVALDAWTAAREMRRAEHEAAVGAHAATVAGVKAEWEQARRAGAVEATRAKAAFEAATERHASLIAVIEAEEVTRGAWERARADAAAAHAVAVERHEEDSVGYAADLDALDSAVATRRLAWARVVADAEAALGAWQRRVAAVEATREQILRDHAARLKAARAIRSAAANRHVAAETAWATRCADIDEEILDRARRRVLYAEAVAAAEAAGEALARWQTEAGAIEARRVEELVEHDLAVNRAAEERAATRAATMAEIVGRRRAERQAARDMVAAEAANFAPLVPPRSIPADGPTVGVAALPGEAPVLKRHEPAPSPFGDAFSDAPSSTEVEVAILARLAAHRTLVAGALPLVIDEALDGQHPHIVSEVLDMLARMSTAVQIVFLTEDERIEAWARARYGEAGVRRAA